MYFCVDSCLFTGYKGLYDLYGHTLKDKMKKEYKDKKWDPRHKATLAEATKKLEDFKIAQPNPVGLDKLVKEDLEAQVEMLNTLSKTLEGIKYKDVGPCMDCIVFHDGEKWR